MKTFRSLFGRPHAGLIAALCAVSLCLPLNAQAERPLAPQIDLSALPAIAPGWAEANPLRGDSIAVTLGRDAYNQACGRCHGVDADGSRAPAPDLRRIGRRCGRIADTALRQRCTEDNDHYFTQSVRKGKIKLGVEHMPPWEGILEPAMVWSIRSFVETVKR